MRTKSVTVPIANSVNHIYRPKITITQNDNVTVTKHQEGHQKSWP